MDAVRARWSSGSFLLYAGALLVLATAIWLLGILSDDYGAAAFVGWSALVLAVTAALMVGYEHAGRAVAAGLFAVVSVGVFAVFVGAVEDLVGVFPEDVDGTFDGFHIGIFVLLLLAIAAAAVLRRRYRFPLLVLPLAGFTWYLLVDLVSNGGDWSAVVSILVGLVFLVAGLASDRVYGFWWHVVAGVVAGGGILFLWHSGDGEWLLTGLVAVVYIAVGAALARSSYVVLGAFGLFLMTSHFVEEWFGLPAFLFFFLGEDEHEWARPLLYAGLGLLFVLIGLVLEGRRDTALAPAAER